MIIARAPRPITTRDRRKTTMARQAPTRPSSPRRPHAAAALALAALLLPVLGGCGGDHETARQIYEQVLRLNARLGVRFV